MDFSLILAEQHSASSSTRAPVVCSVVAHFSFNLFKVLPKSEVEIYRLL